FFFSSRRRHTRFSRDWSSDVCSSDLGLRARQTEEVDGHPGGTAALRKFQRLDLARRKGDRRRDRETNHLLTRVHEVTDGGPVRKIGRASCRGGVEGGAGGG